MLVAFAGVYLQLSDLLSTDEAEDRQLPHTTVDPDI